METQESEFLTYDDVASVIERYGYTIDIMTTENHKVALCKAIGLVFSYNDITKEITRIDLNGKSIYRLKSSLSIIENACRGMGAFGSNSGGMKM